MKKVVLDTNIIVSALWTSAGNPSKILDMFLIDKVLLYYDSAIMEEYQQVLNRPRLKFSPEEVSWTLNKVHQKGIIITSEISTIQMIDETDRKFYDTAKTAGAILITGNIKHYPIEDFIMPPADFVKLMNQT